MWVLSKRTKGHPTFVMERLVTAFPWKTSIWFKKNIDPNNNSLWQKLYRTNMQRRNVAIICQIVYINCILFCVLYTVGIVALTLANFASHFLCSLSKSGAVLARFNFVTGFSWELSSFLFESVFLILKHKEKIVNLV